MYWLTFKLQVAPPQSSNRYRLILRPTPPVCAIPEMRTLLVESYNKRTENGVDADVINEATARPSCNVTVVAYSVEKLNQEKGCFVYLSIGNS